MSKIMTVLEGESALEFLRKQKHEHDAAHPKRLADGKAAAVRAGREPFDRSTLKRFWDPDRYPGDEVGEEEWEWREYEYYTLSKVQTMEAFARELHEAEFSREP